jgi:hypothetical protein
MRLTRWLGGKVLGLRREHLEGRRAVAALTLTAPHIVVGQHVRSGDGPEVRSIRVVLEQEGVSVEATLPSPDETITELVGALRWLHGEDADAP